MKIYTVFSATEKDKFHAWALSKRLQSHYRSMSNGNFLAIAYGSVLHESELSELGFSLLPPLEESATTLSTAITSMFPSELGILAVHNTYQAMCAYSDKTSTKTFHPRR
jgi:hypothetical protein